MAALVAMSPEAEIKRLFVGTFLSSNQQDMLAKLSESKAELEAHLKCKVRFVKPHKLHLTWLFLGNIQSSKIKEIEQRLWTVANATKKLSLIYNQVEVWPTIKRPRMIVLTPEAVPADVRVLASTIFSDLNSLCDALEHREYRPHITLSRFERDAGPIEIPEWFIQKCSLPIQHELERIELIESELGKTSDEYKSLRCFILV